jgi:hypothetical protein
MLGRNIGMSLAEAKVLPAEEKGVETQLCLRLLSAANQLLLRGCSILCNNSLHRWLHRWSLQARL